MTSITTVTTRTQASEFRDAQDGVLATVFPQELIIDIFSKMNRSCLFAIASTCKYYNALSKDDLIWTSLFHAHFPCPLRKDIDSKEIHPVDAYRKELALHQNLMNGTYTWHQVGNPERSTFSSIDITDDRYFFITSNNEILCGNIKSNAKAKNMRLEAPGSSCRIAAGDKVIVGFNNGEIQIWEPEPSLVCLKTLAEHKQAILLMAYDSGSLYSYSDDHTIKIWDVTSGECVATLGEFDETLKFLTVKEGKIVAGNEAGEIKIWDKEALDSVITLLDENTQELNLVDLVIDNGLIYAGYEDGGGIWVWNIETRNCSILRENDSITSLQMVGDKLISGCDWCTHEVWDLATKKCSLLIRSENYGVDKFAFAEGRLILNLYPSILGILDFNASEKAILEELASWFSLGDSENNTEPLENPQERFSRISEQTKNIIYRHLYNQSSSFNKSIHFEDWGAEGWLDASTEERAAAINAYLHALSSGELPLFYRQNFLLDLGIATLEDFTEAFQCAPTHLLQIGILSSQDLEVLGIHPRPVAHLELSSLSTDLLQLQIDILARLKGMGTGLHARAMDNFKNSLPVRTMSENPWVGFLEKIENFYAKIETQCETQEGLLALFQPESHSRLVAQINDLIDEFNALDQAHFRKKLHAYISQENLGLVWKHFHAKGINSLTKLVFAFDEPIMEPYLFQMGK